jgi:hypothetical protein
MTTSRIKWKKANKVTRISNYLSKVTLNLNGLNFIIKGNKVAD